MNANELKKSRLVLVAALAALAAKPTLTADEDKEFETKKGEVDAIAAQIARLEYVEGQRSVIDRLDKVPVRPNPDAGAKPAAPGVANPGFESLGELVFCLRFKPNDERIHALMEMQTGESGGLGIPDEFNPLLREVGPQEAIFRPRCTVVPAGDAPDAEMSLPYLNQQSGSNMYGGVSVDWVAEGGEKPETTAKIKLAKWLPKEVCGHIVVTDKLLRNWAAAGPLIDRLLRGALLAAEDAAFMNAVGGSRPLGVLKSPALKSVNRATANTVKYVDLCKMEAELHEDGPSFFVINPRVLPVLRQMEDTEGHLIWNDSARDGGIPTLLGRPVLKNFRSPALGTKGDVLLIVPQHYVIKDGAGLQVAASEHVLWKQNKTVVKAFKSVDGAPWMDGAIAQEDGQTYSPFVALDVPA